MLDYLLIKIYALKLSVQSKTWTKQNTIDFISVLLILLLLLSINIYTFFLAILLNAKNTTKIMFIIYIIL